MPPAQPTRHFSTLLLATLALLVPATLHAVLSPNDPATVQREIDAAYQSGASRITIPPGTYRLPTLPGGGHHLYFAKLKNFEIDAPGVTFVFTDRTTQPVVFENCENVTIRGVTFTRDPIPFSQGTIEAVDFDHHTFDVRIHRGYPTDIDDPRFFEPNAGAYVFDPKTRQWKSGTVAFSIVTPERLDHDLFRFHTNSLPSGLPIVPGDFLAWRGRGMTDLGLIGCRKMRLEDVTICSGSGFCVHESGGEGENFYRYKVTYGSKPPGATEAPLMSSDADAFHSSGVRHGPTLEDCLFESMPDDGIPIHGEYVLIRESTGDKLIVETHGGPGYLPGDPLRAYDQAGALVGEGVVKSSRPLPDYHPETVTDLRNFKDASRAKFHELTLDHPLPAISGGFAANPAACGSGFVVRRCTVRNNRARGMLIKADHGLIEDCTVEGSTMGGIVVSPEVTYWNEADYSRDLVIRHNTIRAVGIERQEWNPMAGALTIAAHERGKFVPLPGGHRRITVEDNTFENQNGVNIVVSSAEDVLIKNNRFLRPMHSPDTRGTVAGIEPGALLWLTECQGVRLEGNTVIDSGPVLKQKIATTPTAAVSGSME